MIKTYEFYVKVPLYVPIRCDAPDIGTARDYERKLKRYWPTHLRERCKVSVPGIREVKRDSKKQYVCSKKALSPFHADWLIVAESLGIVKDPGEELQYRE